MPHSNAYKLVSGKRRGRCSRLIKYFMRDDSWLNKRFLPTRMPNWKCPTCNSATLSLAGELQEKPSERLQEIPDSYFDESIGEELPFRAEWVEGLKTRFIGFLKCNSKYCNEHVSINGYVATEQDYYDHPEHGPSIDLENFYYPLLFDPPLNYIQNTSRYPAEIQVGLKESCRLYWIDNSSCANKIRTVIEVLLDLEKIPRRKRKPAGGLTTLKLHNRLSLYKKKNPEIAEFLLSIKWTGNTGSHSNTLWNNQILDIFDLLEYSLNHIYVKDEQRLKKISKKINKNKPGI